MQVHFILKTGMQTTTDPTRIKEYVDEIDVVTKEIIGKKAVFDTMQVKQNDVNLQDEKGNNYLIARDQGYVASEWNGKFYVIIVYANGQVLKKYDWDTNEFYIGEENKALTKMSSAENLILNLSATFFETL